MYPFFENSSTRIAIGIDQVVLIHICFEILSTQIGYLQIRESILLKKHAKEINYTYLCVFHNFVFQTFYRTCYKIVDSYMCNYVHIRKFPSITVVKQETSTYQEMEQNLRIFFCICLLLKSTSLFQHACSVIHGLYVRCM